MSKMKDFKKIAVPTGIMHKVCGLCNGSGRKKCITCDGYGTMEDGSNCYICHGEGKVKCNVCNGYGYYDD